MSGRPDWRDCLYRPSTFCDAERGEGRAALIFRHGKFWRATRA